MLNIGNRIKNISTKFQKRKRGIAMNGIRPICQDCYFTYGYLDFMCEKCDKIDSIAEKTTAYIKIIEDRLILTAQIAANVATGRTKGKLIVPTGYYSRRVLEHYNLGV